jgi:hypothetical protein
MDPKSHPTKPAKSPLPSPQRHISTHDPVSGEAIFSTVFPAALPASDAIPGMAFFDAYRTFAFPGPMTDEADLRALDAFQPGDELITFPSRGQLLLRILDMPPLGGAPLHRTPSLDLIVVVNGELEAILIRARRGR